jgi:integrase
MYRYMDRVGTSPQYRAAIKLLLLTMVRKSELSNATWSEINFSEALWTIPKEDSTSIVSDGFEWKEQAPVS